MENIKEDFLHFVWENRLFLEDFNFFEGEKIEILETGQHNFASGPDYFNARIKIGDTVWAGNVEIHVRASDWFRHRHEEDPAYQNVILHAVYDADCLLERPGGEIIPTFVLKFDEVYSLKYERLIKSRGIISCCNELQRIDGIFRTEWISKLMIERLEEKTAEVSRILSENKYDWEETLYLLLGRCFGFKVNAYPFEALVRTVPLSILLRFRQKADTINAILFGQAGFLEDFLSSDRYFFKLRREYQSLVRTLPGRTLSRHDWKFMGTRPGNFPDIRISQFAAVIVNQFPLFAKLKDNPDLKIWRKIFVHETNLHVGSRYYISKAGNGRNPLIGGSAKDLLILNAFVPLIFHYGNFHRNPDIKDRVINLLEKMPSEKNVLMNQWAKFGIKASTSFESQALIHLATRYCMKKRCLDCRFGSRLIRNP